MRASIVAVLVVTVVASAPSLVSAQPGTGPGAGGPRGRGARVYDPKTVQTVVGDVVEVRHVRRGRAGGGVHLVIRTEGGKTITVHLGPAWYVDAQRVRIAPKDHVAVTGSRVEIDGTEAVVAARVKKGGETLVLRDAAGIPAWRGGPARGRRP